MRSLSSGLAAALAQGYVATLCLVTLKDGTIQGYTDHDAPLTVGGQTYQPAAGMTAIQLHLSNNASVSTQNIQAGWTPIISEAAVLSGRYDFAQVAFALCAWNAPSDGSVPLFGGRLGMVKYTDQGFQADIFSNMWSLSQFIGIEFTANCRHKFGATADPNGVGGCFFDASGLTFPGTIVGEILSAVEFYATIDAQTPGTPNSPGAPSITVNPVYAQQGGSAYLDPTQGAPYSYSVSAIVNGIESAPSPISSIYILSPLNNQSTWEGVTSYLLNGEQIGATNTIGWGAVPNASAYNVYGRTTQTLLATVSGTSWTDDGSSAGGTVAPPYGDYFSNGLVTMTSGQAAGLSREVKFAHSGRLSLWLPFERPVAVGDTFSIIVGCVKTTSACMFKFNNLLNFGGFPGIQPELLYRSPRVQTGGGGKKG